MTPLDTVIGSGTTALAYALFRARHAHVQLCTRRRMPRHRSIESVPAAALTLLVELGISPHDLDVTGLHRRRLVAWGDASPTEYTGPACAHIDTAALRAALAWRIDACPNIARTHRFNARTSEMARVDATGRTAITARHRHRPPRTWTAAAVTTRSIEIDGALRLASAADGYAYRLGSTTWTTVGFVGPGASPRTGAELRGRIEQVGAAWLLEGCQLPDRVRTECRPASVAIPVPSDRAIAIGDAALSRDAMASQGVSIGLSDACLLAEPTTASQDIVSRHTEAAQRHIRHLSTIVSSCRHADAPAWSEYRCWLKHIALEHAGEETMAHVHR